MLLGTHSTHDFGCARHGAKTVAIGIPEGRVQLSSESMQRYRAAVNTWLQDWASSSETSGRVLYLDFPIPFSDDTGDWEGDGLHMSAQGYQKLGRLLGPLIRNFVGCSERELAAGS
ncbi:unnamed protein product [Ostreobium quekettii]|uniref:SGNH hydrolase-type esterase domain-containing protein n=1 Tax=Ostreobium quekettii TaxID=121088 RepID=A0A8S1J591_9CHLO|nr:unnamed protein product [Ostreobium quekettii]|eukprot:evm.model.scf_928.2 EVM.evm.TU.scf_928.2   scf_928:13358-13705(-)